MLKKLLILSATGLVGFGFAVPVATSVCADSKSGETTITYQGEAKPAAWGLSVPSQLRIDKTAKTQYDNSPVVFNNLRSAIVTEDGKNFTDSTKNHNFTILPTSTGELCDDKGDAKAFAYVKPMPQGVSAPTDDMDYGSSCGFQVLPTVKVATSKDGSNPAPFVDFQIGLLKNSATLPDNKPITGKISWTATENT